MSRSLSLGLLFGKLCYLFLNTSSGLCEKEMKRNSESLD